MADQANFPNIYIDGVTGGDGSLASPYSSFGDINWGLTGDNAVGGYYAGTPTASVKIHFKRDTVWRDDYNMSVAGDATYPIYLTSYATGDDPIFLGSVLVSDGSVYKWTPTSNWTSSYKEYYLELLGGGVTPLSEPKQVHIDDVRCSTYNLTLLAPEAIGVLQDHAFAWGDAGNGFDTIVIRDESGDPDTTGAVIEASQGNNWVFYLDQPYYVIENLDCRHSNGHGFRIVNDARNNHNVVIQDCVAKYNAWAGVQVYNAGNCIVRRCDLSHSAASCLNINGASDLSVLGLVVEDCDIHDADLDVGPLFSEGSGMKAFRIDYSTFRRNRWYNNPSGGFRFDGVELTAGCDFNEVYENEFFNNGGVRGNLYFQMEFEFSSDNLVYSNYFHDPWGGGPNIGMSHSITDRNYIFNNVLTGSYTSDYRGSLTLQTFAGDSEGDQNYLYGNLIIGASQAIRISSGPWTVLRNNIVVDSIGIDLNITETSFASTIDSDYNCFTGLIRVYHTSYTLAQWQTYSAGIGNPCDVHSINDDPMLTDPDNGDFSLQTGSPCIGKGENLGEPFNIGLLPGSSWPDGVIIGDRDDT